MAEKYVAATNIKIDGELIERGEVVTAKDLKTQDLKGEDNLEILISEGSVITQAAYHQAFPDSAPVDVDTEDAQSEADQIVADAKAEAEKIIADAQAEAEKIKTEAAPEEQSKSEDTSATTAAGKDAGKATTGTKK